MKLSTIIRRAAKSKRLIHLTSLTGICLFLAFIILALSHLSKDFPSFTTYAQPTTKPLSTPCCQPLADSLVISFLNVGQGEAILIRCPDTTTFNLIDGGDCNSNYPKAEDMFTHGLFSRFNTTKSRFRYIINTHSHPDHICGINRLLKRGYYPDAAYIDNGIIFTEQDLVSEIYDILKRKNIKHFIPPPMEISTIFPCPDTPTIKLYFFPQYRTRDKGFNCQLNFNDCSLVAMLEFGSFRLLMQADVSTKWEEVALDDEQFNEFLPVEAIKIGHHASSFSTSKTYLRRTNPSFAIFSSGKPGNPKIDSAGYSNSVVLRRIHQQLQKKHPSSISAFIETSVCKYINGKCHWKTEGLHPRLRGTMQGSIDLCVSQSGSCLMTKQIER